MNTVKKPVALLWTVLFIIIVALTVSVLCTVLEVNHDCCGADCPVCLMVSFCRHAARVVLLIGGGFFCIRAVSLTKKFVPFFGGTVSPVRLKIKLSC